MPSLCHRNTTLTPEAGASLDALLAAMKDHVLASGELIGLGVVDPNAPPPARGTPGQETGAPHPKTTAPAGVVAYPTSRCSRT